MHRSSGGNRNRFWPCRTRQPVRLGRAAGRRSPRTRTRRGLPGGRRPEPSLSVAAEAEQHQRRIQRQPEAAARLGAVGRRAARDQRHVLDDREGGQAAVERQPQQQRRLRVLRPQVGQQRRVAPGAPPRTARRSSPRRSSPARCPARRPCAAISNAADGTSATIARARSPASGPPRLDQPAGSSRPARRTVRACAWASISRLFGWTTPASMTQRSTSTPGGKIQAGAAVRATIRRSGQAASSARQSVAQRTACPKPWLLV